ncbi:MAG: amidohydrolase [Firmicutes bacterium]|nr:amidohydrolase [Bacillota bacterium]
MSVYLKAAIEMRDEIEDTWNALHGMPEPPFQETKTAGFIASQLAEAGFNVKEGLADTGLVAELPDVAGSDLTGPVIALRADMDAMGHRVEGQKVWVHSCGHDAHSTMVMAAGMMLARECGAARGRLRLIFQPGEETGLGAGRMVEAGAVRGVDALLGIHLRPISECRLGQATPCLWHSAGRTLSYSVVGKPSHTGRPHLGVNVADAVAMATLAVNSVKPDPLKCATANVVALSAGKGPGGVIPEQGTLTVNIRSESDQIADELGSRVDRAVKAAAAANGAQAELEREKQMPAPCYDEGMVDTARRAIVSVLGEVGVVERITTPGSEDFHWYARRSSGLRAAYIGLGADFSPGLHHPDASFDLQALVYGAAILAEAVAGFVNSDANSKRRM